MPSIFVSLSPFRLGVDAWLVLSSPPLKVEWISHRSKICCDNHNMCCDRAVGCYDRAVSGHEKF